MSGAAVLAPAAPPLIAAGPIGWAILGLAAAGLTVATVVLGSVDVHREAMMAAARLMVAA